MRKIIAVFEVSADGFIEGPNGELDWVDAWEDTFDLMPHIDACLLGGGMYPGYEQYWRAILANPTGILPSTGRPATKGEIAYAEFADKTPHFVLSTRLEQPAWKTTHIIRDVEDIRRMKQQAGKDIYAVGGATLVSSLLNCGLLDEIRLMVHPTILGSGKAPFKNVKERQGLTFVRATTLASGNVGLTYQTQSSQEQNHD